jgi:hypothetical protein
VTKAKPTPRAAIYIRVADDPDRTGAERQADLCREYIKQKMYREVKIYQDLNHSAYDDQRPQYQQLQRDIEAGLIDVIVCDRPERLTRKPEHLAALLEVIDGTGCRIETSQTGTWHHTAKMLVIGMQWAQEEWANEKKKRTPVNDAPIDVFVPNEDHPIRAMIAAGSGIVGGPALRGGNLEVDYEGNLYGAANIVTYADRISLAHGRMAQHYPTVARTLVEPEAMTRVGTYLPATGVVDLRHATPQAKNLLCRWLHIPFDQLAAQLLTTNHRHALARTEATR